MTLYNSESQDHGMADILDWKLVESAKAALEDKTPVFASFDVKNVRPYHWYAVIKRDI
jgi:glutamate synthase (NADPH/NADH) large chain